MGNDNLEYFHTYYEPEQLKEYLSSLDEKEFYDTNVDITSSDNFLALQTCVRDRDDLRLIVIAKEIEVIDIFDKNINKKCCLKNRIKLK